MAGEIIIRGKVCSYSQGFGDGMTLLLQREPLTKWESSNPDRVILPLEVPPWTAKTLKAPSPGAWVDVEVRLMGREYKGKHYLSAQVVSVESRGAEMEQGVAQAGEPEPTGAPVMPAGSADSSDDGLPF